MRDSISKALREVTVCRKVSENAQSQQKATSRSRSHSHASLLQQLHLVVE
jgi:hypothetical protein